MANERPALRVEISMLRRLDNGLPETKYIHQPFSAEELDNPKAIIQTIRRIATGMLEILLADKLQEKK